MIKLWDIILGVILIFYIIGINLISSAKIAFSLPIIILGIILIIYHFVKSKVKENKVIRKVYKVVEILICIGLIGFLGIEALIINYPKENKEKADYIVVLGAGLSNRKIPSVILKGRLDAAIETIMNILLYQEAREKMKICLNLMQ